MNLSKVKLKDDELFKGDRIEIKPTDEIKYYLIMFDALFRDVYNWGIKVENKAYEMYKQDKNNKGFYSFIELSMMYDDEIKANPDMEYLKDLPLNTAREALKEVDNSFQMFFKGYNKAPKFRVKDRNLLSFRTRPERASIDETGVRIEGLPKGVRIHTDDRRYDNYGNRLSDIKRLYNTGIIFDGDKYWFTFQFIIKVQPLNIEISNPVGVDIGQKHPAVTSSGMYYEKPDMVKLDKQIIRMQRHVARDRKLVDKMLKESNDPYITKDDLISKNMIKRQTKLRQLQRRKNNIMKDFYYKVALDIVNKNPAAICLETMRVNDILTKYPSSHKYMHDIAMYKFSEIIKFEAKKHGVPTIIADKEYPSSQLCNRCGYLNKNIGGHRIFICPNCGTRICRDLNASINLQNLYYN